MNKENLIYYLLSISMYPILTSSKTLSPSEWMKVCSNSITDGQLEFCALSLDQAKENTKNGKMENFSDYDIIIKEEAVKNKTQEYLRDILLEKFAQKIWMSVKTTGTVSYGLEYLDPLQVNLDTIKKMLPEDLITGNSDIVVKNVTIHGLSTLQLKNVSVLRTSDLSSMEIDLQLVIEEAIISGVYTGNILPLSFLGASSTENQASATIYKIETSLTILLGNDTCNNIDTLVTPSFTYDKVEFSSPESMVSGLNTFFDLPFQIAMNQVSSIVQMIIQRWLVTVIETLGLCQEG